MPRISTVLAPVAEQLTQLTTTAQQVGEQAAQQLAQQVPQQVPQQLPQPGTLFGYTEAQFADLFLTFGVPAFIIFMLFIIGQLAWESKAGKFGTFVLFLGLAVGFIGFIAKGIIQWMIEHGH